MTLKSNPWRTSLLALALLTAPCWASDGAPTAAQQKELAQAQAELERAAKRVAELSLETNRKAFELQRQIERRPMLGVLLAPDASAGVRVTGVTPNSGAAQAGIRSGDQLIRINGTAISGGSGEHRVDLARSSLTEIEAGQPVAITYRRGGQDHEVNITPQAGDPVMVFQRIGDQGDVLQQIYSPDGQLMQENLRGREWELAIAPAIETELLRLGELASCEGDDCTLSRLNEAFRWSGLNLATLDAGLGRYFGTDQGVLVLSSGEELAGLQAGDVIRKVDGRTVSSPREVMNALRGKAPESTANIEYLRDRRSAKAAIRIPRSMPLRVPLPPAAPAPPSQLAPPAPPAPVPPPPPVPPVAPTPPTSTQLQRIDQRQKMRVDAQRKAMHWQNLISVARLAPLPSAPAATTGMAL